VSGAPRGWRLARWRLLLLPPWRRAPLRLFASFGLFLSVVVAALVLGIAAAARPLYSASSGSASLHEDLTKGCSYDVGLRIKQDAALTSTPIDDPSAFPSVELGTASAAIESAVRASTAWLLR
jgi:hypothetical protein